MAIATASASYAMSPRQRVAALEQRRLAHRTSQLYQFQRQEQQLADLQDICGRLRRDPPSERDDVAPVVAKVQRHLQETAGRLEQQGKEAIERTLWHLEKTCEQERVCCERYEQDRRAVATASEDLKNGLEKLQANRSASRTYAEPVACA
eukprot:GHVT01078942.1.p1 GENE.GHVT01078942.1~~GHVT01078942.1.p1  ORF type:complete len:150 (-),score=35.28 GHVT01078942.1:926-1375(-)